MGILYSTGQKNRGIFDVILSWASALGEKGATPLEIDEFISRIEKLERDLQDLELELLNKAITARLSYWYSLAEDQAESFDLAMFSQNIFLISSIMRKVSDFNEKIIIEDIAKILPFPPKEWLESSNSFIGLEGIAINNKIKALQKSYSSGTLSDARQDASVNGGEWSMKIVIEKERASASEIGFLIWSVSEAVELVDGVKVTLDDWGRGSYWIKLKIWFADVSGRKEVKEILEKARDAAIAEQLDKRIEGVEKLKAERQKIQLERDTLEAANARAETCTEAAERRQLELRKIELDVQFQELALQERKLDLAKKVAYMVKEGLIFAQPVYLEINGLGFLSVKDEKIVPGESMDAIDDAGNTPANPGDSKPPSDPGSPAPTIK